MPRFQIKLHKTDGTTEKIDAVLFRISDTNVTYKENFQQGRWASIALRFIRSLEVEHIAITGGANASINNW